MSANSAASTIPVMDVRSRFRMGITFNLIGAVFNQGSTFAANIFLARIFGRTLFGEYAIVQSTILTLSVVFQFAVPYTLTKYLSEYRSSEAERAERILATLFVVSVGLAAISGLSLFLAAPWLASSIFHSPGLAFPFAVAAVALFFLVMIGFAMAALAGLERYRTLANSMIWSGIAYFLLCTGLGWSRGLNGAVVGLALSGAIQFLLLANAVRRECAIQGVRLRFGGFRREREILLRFALPAGLAGLTSASALWLPSTFLVRQANGYAQMAMYSAAYSLMTAILFLPNVTNTVGMSLINHHQGTGKASAYEHTFWANLFVNGSIVAIGSGLCAVLGPWLLHFYGSDFKEGYSVLLLLLLATIPQALALAMYQIIQSHAKMWLSLLVFAAPRDLLMVGAAYRLIPLHGANGLASAYALAWTLACVIVALIVFQSGIVPASTGAMVLESKTLKG